MKILILTTCRKIFPIALIPSGGLTPIQKARALPTVSTTNVITPKYVNTDKPTIKTNT